jgi:mevalonate kinase
VWYVSTIISSHFDIVIAANTLAHPRQGKVEAGGDHLPQLLTMCMPMTTTSVCASAPGKVILFGEHAVVFGEPAVAAALSDLRITVKVTTNNEDEVWIEMPDLPTPIDVKFDAKGLRLQSLKEPPTKQDAASLQRALLNQIPSLNELGVSALVPLIYLMNQLTPTYLEESGLHIQVRSQDLPVGAGLGSSAAFGVACAAALLRLSLLSESADATPKLGKPPQDHLEIINTFSFYSEILLHGTPSGIDNAVSTFGGAIDYTKKDGESSMQKFDMPPLDMLMANTHVPRSTKVLVSGVRSLYEQHPTVIGCILNCMGNIAGDFRQLTSFDGPELLTLVRTNQHMLRSVGVSHPSLDHLCEVVESVSKGVASAKLTGAGGGGCAMIVLQPGEQSRETSRKIQDALENKKHPWKFSCLQSAVGREGVIWLDPDSFPEKGPDLRSPSVLTVTASLACAAALGIGMVSLTLIRKR